MPKEQCVYIAAPPEVPHDSARKVGRLLRLEQPVLKGAAKLDKVHTVSSPLLRWLSGQAPSGAGFITATLSHLPLSPRPPSHLLPSAALQRNRRHWQVREGVLESVLGHDGTLEKGLELIPWNCLCHWVQTQPWLEKDYGTALLSVKNGWRLYGHILLESVGMLFCGLAGPNGQGSQGRKALSCLLSCSTDLNPIRPQGLRSVPQRMKHISQCVFFLF